MKESLIEQIIPQTVIRDLTNLVDDYEITDLIKRADIIKSIMEELEFEEIGCGTNRIVFIHEDYPTYVFKIALDSRGVLDNNNEFKLTNIMKSSKKQIITTNYESIGVISIAERINVFTKYDMEEAKDTIMKILEVIGKYFILNDVGTKAYKNWGYDNDGNIKCLDYAYLTSIENVVRNKCTCGGQLNYTENMLDFRCTECDKLFTYNDIVSNTYSVLDSMGFKSVCAEDFDNNGLLDLQELEFINTKMNITDIPSRTDSDILRSMGFV